MAGLLWSGENEGSRDAEALHLVRELCNGASPEDNADRQGFIAERFHPKFPPGCEASTAGGSALSPNEAGNCHTIPDARVEERVGAVEALGGGLTLGFNKEEASDHRRAVVCGERSGHHDAKTEHASV